MAMVVAVVVTMIVVVMMTTKIHKRKEKQTQVEYTARGKTEGLRVKKMEEEE
jgi:NADH:ubiquinone oxidoreductase subunit 6 (subunit J)